MSGRVVAMLGVALSILAAGCPGQRRPDPRWASRATPPAPGPAAPASPAPPAAGAEELEAARAEVTRLEAAFTAAPADHAAWLALVEAIGRAENVATAMSEREGPESDAGYEALEDLARLRSDVVRREPRPR